MEVPAVVKDHPYIVVGVIGLVVLYFLWPSSQPAASSGNGTTAAEIAAGAQVQSAQIAGQTALAQTESNNSAAVQQASIASQTSIAGINATTAQTQAAAASASYTAYANALGASNVAASNAAAAETASNAQASTGITASIMDAFSKLGASLGGYGTAEGAVQGSNVNTAIATGSPRLLGMVLGATNVQQFANSGNWNNSSNWNSGGASNWGSGNSSQWNSGGGFGAGWGGNGFGGGGSMGYGQGGSTFSNQGGSTFSNQGGSNNAGGSNFSSGVTMTGQNNLIFNPNTITSTFSQLGNFIAAYKPPAITNVAPSTAPIPAPSSSGGVGMMQTIGGGGNVPMGAG